jgi:hypothetical protein
MDEQTNKNRYTTIGMTVETYGTDAQREASLERLKSELALQGFNITFFIVINTGDLP